VGKTRSLARGNTKNECQKAIDRMKRNFWNQISEIKEDPSLAYTGGDISYVAVMEKKDDPSKNKAHRWNNNLPIID
jgi:hypothetical protein